MNAGRFERSVAMASVDMAPSHPARIDITRCRETTELPCRVKVLERHPLGSQAFMPLAEFVFVVVVAPPGDAVDTDSIRAFASNGRQGINYHRGTWHMPMIGAAGQSFLLIERDDDEGNCEEFRLDPPLTLAGIG